jgi:hypothetical protein
LQRVAVVAQVGLHQADHAVAIELVKVGRNLTAVLQVQTGLEAFLDDAHRLAERLALGDDVLAIYGTLGRLDVAQQGVEQQTDQLVRVGTLDAGFGGNPAVGGGGS